MPTVDADKALEASVLRKHNIAPLAADGHVSDSLYIFWKSGSHLPHLLK